MISFSVFSSAGLTFWYGVKLLLDGEVGIDSGAIVTVSFIERVINSLCSFSHTDRGCCY